MPLLGGRNGLMGTEREATALSLPLSVAFSSLVSVGKLGNGRRNYREQGEARESERARESACITFAYSSSKYYNNRPNRTEREDTLNRA